MICRISLVVQWLRIYLQCKGHGFDPWSGKIPHALEQVSRSVHHSYEAHMPYSPCSATREANAMRNHVPQLESSPSSPQLQKACVQQQRPSAAKKNQLILKKNMTYLCLQITFLAKSYVLMGFLC